MTWKEYEHFVMNYFKSRYPHSNIEHNIFRKGYNSKTDRQLDIFIQQNVCGYNIEMAIECKNWNKSLTVGDVEQFISKLRDIRVTKGVMVTRIGYSKAAKQTANGDGNIHLHVLRPEELPDFSGFWGNPYHGNCGAILFPPNGWLLDSKVPKELYRATLCIMHPMELTSIGSLQTKECILFYIPYITSIAETNSQMEKRVERLLKEQEIKTRNSYSNVIFHYSDLITKKGKTKFRLIEYKNYNEIAHFIYTPYCIIFIFGICQKEFTDEFKKHVRFVTEELMVVVLQNVDLKNSHEAWTKFLILQNQNSGELQKVIFY